MARLFHPIFVQPRSRKLLILFVFCKGLANMNSFRQNNKFTFQLCEKKNLYCTNTLIRAYFEAGEVGSYTLLVIKNGKYFIFTCFTTLVYK